MFIDTSVKLWNIIRDFIVMYLTGGTLSDGSAGYFGTVGSLYDISNEENELVQTNTLYMGNLNGYEITLGDWLATTLTIVAMLLIFIFAIWLVRWVFKMVSSAFLLRR